MKKVMWVCCALLLCSASASAQEPPCQASGRVWRDGDLQRPLARSRCQPEASAMAGLQRRNELQTPLGRRYGSATSASLPAASLPAAPALPPPVPRRDINDHSGQFFASQLLPLRVEIVRRPAPLLCPTPIRRYPR